MSARRVNLDHLLMSLPNSISSLDSNLGVNYPPHNIIKISETDFLIEIAAAGFSKDELSVYAEMGGVVVSGARKIPSEDKVHQYVHRGLAKRDFVLKFPIAASVRIQSAEYTNGILSVKLVSREEKTQIIEIL